MGKKGLALGAAALFIGLWLWLFFGGTQPRPQKAAAPPAEAILPVPDRDEAWVAPGAPPSSNGPEPQADPQFRYTEATELAVLREAYQLNQTDKPRALALLLDAERTYGDIGHMVQARLALIVSLLVDTGRMADARDRARVFIERYPDSRYRGLVQGVTGIHPRPSPSESAAMRAP